MEDVLLEQFLKGEPLLIRKLRQIVQDFVTKTGGSPDDAKEVFQIISLAIFERSRRTLSQYVGKAFKSWLNKRRKDALYVGERVRQLETILDRAFAGQADLKTGIRQNEPAALLRFTQIAMPGLAPLVKEEGGDEAAAGEIIAVAIEKIRRVILDLTDYFLKSCKNEWFRLKKKRGMIRPEEEITHSTVEDDAESLMHERMNLILNLLQKLSETCQKLLHPLLFEGKSKTDLMPLLGYSTSDSFDVAKSRCMSALRANL